MSTTELKILFPSERLDALRFFMEKKDQTVEQELNLLLVHGVLHLLGYDHGDDEAAAVMQQRERELLDAYSRAEGW